MPWDLEPVLHRQDIRAFLASSSCHLHPLPANNECSTARNRTFEHQFSSKSIDNISPRNPSILPPIAMKNRIQNSVRFTSAGLCLLFSLLVNHTGATVIYWDNNGASTPTGGTWNTTSSFWATSSVLVASPGKWVTSDAACFTAGATSPGAITITVNSAINCAGIFNGSLTPPGCTLTISGTGSLNTPGGLNWALDTSGSNGDPTTIAVPITGGGNVTLEGGAPCTLNAA